MPFFGSLDFLKKVMTAKTEQPLPTHTSFLTSNSNSNSNQKHQHQPQENNNNSEEETLFDDVLARLEGILTILGFKQSSLLSFTLSWTAFTVVGVAAPLLALQVYNKDKNQIKGFEICIVAFQTCLAAVSLICISHNLRKYGLIKFLFLDRQAAQMPCFHHDYVKQISVSTLVQVVGIIICLHAATKISHRAQGIVSLASRWHALATCTAKDSGLRSYSSTGSLEGAKPLNSIDLDYSESDIESSDYIGVPSNTQLASYVSSHHKRQAFVMYLQTNAGGISIFGWTVDRSLVNTIFFFELTLVTFVLSKTIL